MSMKQALKDKIFDRIIQADQTLLTALKQMDQTDKKLLLIFKGEKFLSILTIGDIQRAIIKNFELETKVEKVYRKAAQFSYVEENITDVKNKMLNNRTECMPVLDENKNLVDIILWEDLFIDDQSQMHEIFDLPVVIMAGGRGSRLKPLTNVLPKPLIPIGEKTILETIMDSFSIYGVKQFYLSVNYKAEMIEQYLNNLNHGNYTIHYFHERKPLGTVGSLFMMNGVIDKTFFISNCDILIDSDYSEMLKYHRENKNELTIISALKHYSIPYGIVETGLNGELTSLKEKPELTFQINSGLYILEPHLLSEIPQKEFFHITQLIEKILKRNGNVGVFPVSERSWMDIGKWDDYHKNVIKY